MTASKPAYLRTGALSTAPSHRAPAPAGGVSEAELDAALIRAARAEARAQRVARLERELAGTQAAPARPGEVPRRAGQDEGEQEHHRKTHWWSRH